MLRIRGFFTYGYAGWFFSVPRACFINTALCQGTDLSVPQRAPKIRALAPGVALQIMLADIYETCSGQSGVLNPALMKNNSEGRIIRPTRGAPLAPLLRVWERQSAQSVKSAVEPCSGSSL